MLCPKCTSKTGVKDSRTSKQGITRRRACEKCGYRFTTEEKIVNTKPTRAAKKRQEKKQPVKIVKKFHSPVKKNDFDDIWADLTDDELEAGLFDGSIQIDD